MTRKNINIAVICLLVGAILGGAFSMYLVPRIEDFLAPPSWEITPFDGLIAPDGSTFPLEGDYRWNNIIAEDKTRCVLMHGSGSICLVDSKTEKTICCSAEQKVVDYLVTDAAVYWLNLDREVWVCDWKAEAPEPYLYVMNAVSFRRLEVWPEGVIIVERSSEDGSTFYCDTIVLE